MRFRLAAAAAVALSLSAATVPAQTVVASTFGPGSSFTPNDGYYIANGAAEYISWVATPFTASAGGALSTVRIAASVPFTSFTAPGPLLVGLYQGADMNSATLLEQFSTYPPAGPGAIVSFASSLHPMLGAGQSYFVALSTDDPMVAFYRWNVNDQGITSTIWFGGRGTWDPEAGAPAPAFDVAVTGTTTPEPATLALLGGGLLALGSVARARGRS